MYYKIKYGLDELPAGEEKMGSYIKKVYTSEQRQRLGVDKEGNRQKNTEDSEPFNNKRSPTHGPRSKLFSTLQNNSMRITRATSPARAFNNTPSKFSELSEDDNNSPQFQQTMNSTIGNNSPRFQNTVMNSNSPQFQNTTMNSNSPQFQNTTMNSNSPQFQNTTTNNSGPQFQQTMMTNEFLQQRTRRKIELRPIRRAWIRTQKLKFIHKLSSYYYNFYHFYLCFVPSVMFAVIAGVMALLLRTSNEVVDSNDDLGAIVGIFAITSAVWQCISSQLGLNTKAREHASASELFQNIENDCLTHFSDSDVSTVRKLIELVNHGCKSNPPLRISQAFELMDSRVVQQTHTEALVVSDDQIVNVRVSIFRELYCTLSRFKFWPVFVPDPTSAVEEAMRRYREPLEREISNGSSSHNREKYEKYTIGDLFTIRRLRSARVNQNRVVPTIS